MRNRIFVWVSCLFFLLAAFFALAAVSAGFGTRLGLWDFRTGFVILRLTAYGGLASAALSAFVALVGLSVRGPKVSLALSALGLVIGGAVFYVPASWWREAQRVPMIHDITTDPGDPPEFVMILPLRKNAPNPPEYGGPDVAEKQRAAYPDVKPLTLPEELDKAFEKALVAARKMDWEIVDANKRAGRIEATDTTFWFGFKDDVVIRVRPVGEGRSRIDVRSTSRVGMGDIGTNAKRVRNYLKAVDNG